MSALPNSSKTEQIGNCTRPTAIYALCEFPSWRPRYVGKTTQYLQRRHKAHIRDANANRNLPVHYWLRKQIRNGERLAIKLLEYVPLDGDWIGRERHWIAKLRDEHPDLLNLTAGGEGLHGHRFTEAHRNKIAAALRTGSHFNCETCGKQFWRKPYAITRGNNRFCSRGCSNRRSRS